MSNSLDYQLSYRRNLPHIQPGGATFFITFRLYGSIPVDVLASLADQREQRLAQVSKESTNTAVARRLYDEEKRHFGRLDQLLDKGAGGPLWLREPAVAGAIADAIHNRDRSSYDLLTYCIMPNHVHMVITPRERGTNEYYSLSRIMHVLKGFSAKQANSILGRSGTFWQAESYDHFVRDSQELQRIVRYVLQNPVKAKLVDDATEWPWSYVKEW